jgi:predicted O-methyltransferase YrrM
MKHLQITNTLYNYMLDISLREHDALQALREETTQLPLSVMQTAPEEAQFLQFMIRLLGAKKVLELGTFTGYSALAMALALPQGGQLITCDINTQWTNIAHPYWEQANVSNKIDLRIGPALETLRALLKDGAGHSFDFIFIDADKTNYVEYYELSLQLIKPAGLIAIDNIFWEGDVINPLDTSAQTREIRKLNEHIRTDKRVHTSLLPIADGLFLIHPNHQL